MTQLVDVTPDDLDWIVRSLGDWDCSNRWTSHGYTPSPERLSAMVWNGAAVTKKAELQTGSPVGLFQLVNPNLDSGYAYVEFLLDSSHRVHWDSAFARFIQLVTNEFPLRKLCIAASPDEFEFPPGLADAVDRVGSLKEHVRRSIGQFADVDLYEMWLDKQ